MKYLIGFCLIIVSISLINCSGLIQPVSNSVSPLQAPTQAVNKVTATPRKQIIPINETEVAHPEAKGQTVSVMVSPRTPTPPPTPVWIDDNLVVVLEPSWPPPVIELQVGQQLAVMPQLYIGYEWKLRYNTNILELMEDVTQSKVPDAAWIWTAKKVGETTLRLSSGPPPCHEQPKPCTLGAGISLVIEVKVI